MKFKKKPKSEKVIKAKSGLASLANSSQKTAPAGKLAWLTQGENKIKSLYKLQSQQSFRAPELWLVQDQPRAIRFRQSEPLGSFMAYRYPVGKRWESATAPAPGERDLLAEAGMRPSLRAVYEVLDIDGYTDKEGKKKRNLPRYFVVGGQLFNMIASMKEQLGGLTKRVFKVTRTGSGKSTSYTIIPMDKDKTPFDWSQIPSIAGDIAKHYGPPSLEKQRQILASQGKSVDEDESDDE